MKKEILKLRAEGKTYNQIVEILGCSKSMVSYCCGQGQQEKTLKRNKKWKENNCLLVKLNNADNRLRKKVDSFKRRTDLRNVRKSNSDILSYKTVKEKLEQYPFCYLTGREIDLNNSSSYHLDHFVPTSKGGSNSFDNLKLACKEANLAKNNLSLEEFLSLCKEVLIHHGYDVKKNGGP